VTANPDTRRPSASAGTVLSAPLDEAIVAAAAALMEHRGMLRIAAVDSSREILRAVADRLPSTFRTCFAQEPTTLAAVWNALFQGVLPDGEEPGPRLREILWQRSRAGVGTVLGVTETAAMPDGVLAVLEELAGMEPMLQIILVSEAAVPEHTTEAAARLDMRVRSRIDIEFVEPTPFAEAAPEATAEVAAKVPAELRAEVAAEVPARPAAEVAAELPGGAPAAPVADTAGVLVAQLEAASQRTFDPFRGHLAHPAIDTPQLLPVLSDPHGLHAEWFRVLRLRLEDWIKAQGGTPQAIAISGPEAGVGKTFVAVNLALLWANCTFERVLLVDGDLRQPQFHSLFEVPQRPGLADVLARRFRPEECVTFVKEVGLHVMASGRSGNPRQLVNPDRVERVMASLKSMYDVVILDGPPLGGMVDARSFAMACDGTLLVVRSGNTRMRSLQKAMAALPPDRLIGAVVNGVDMGTESAYTRYREAVRR